MFVQVMRGKVRDRALLEQQEQRWREDVRPQAVGFLGSTFGVSDDGEAVFVGRFDSAESARSNSDLPQQSQWWEATAPAFDGNVVFHDCVDVDTFGGGGSDSAGFVQVMTGRAKDQAAMRAMGERMDAEISSARPDVLGGVVAWHGDGGGFTQVVYFSSEAQARAGEASADGGGGADEWAAMIDGEIAFVDLRQPRFM